MKKYCILILCIFLIVLIPLYSFAEREFTLNDFIYSKQFPITYQAFLSEIPAFPTAELIPGGCMIRGLEAWGITRDNMIRWEQDPNTFDWIKHPDVQYEDAAEFLYKLEPPEDEEEEIGPITGMSFQFRNPCEMYDEIAISVTLEPISPDEGYPGQVCSVQMKKGSVSLELYQDSSYTYTLDPFDTRNEYGFYADYSKSGDLDSLTYFENPKDRSRWFRAERGTDLMTGELFYTVTLFDGSRTDPANLPFELTPDVRIVSSDSAENPDPADPDRMNALNDLPREKAIWRHWPLKGILPEALPEVSAEQVGDKTVYTVRNLRDWGIGSELGRTFIRRTAEEYTARQTSSPDPIPSDQVRIITPLEANEYIVNFGTDQEVLSGLSIYGWAVFDKETKEQKYTYIELTLYLKNGVQVTADHDSRSEWSDNHLVFKTDDGWEITAYYQADQLLFYTVRDYSDEDRFFAWTVRFDEADGESSGYYDTVYFWNKSDDQVEHYKLHREEGQWYTHSDDETFVPEACDPPAFLEHCQMLSVAD